MKKVIYTIVAISLVAFISSCATIQSLTNLANCEYRMKSLTEAKLAGINVQHVNNLQSLKFTDIGKLTSTYINKNLPLSFRLNIEARNPNDQSAVLNKFDWILMIDGKEMTRGSHNDPYLRIMVRQLFPCKFLLISIKHWKMNRERLC